MEISEYYMEYIINSIENIYWASACMVCLRYGVLDINI